MHIDHRHRRDLRSHVFEHLHRLLSAHRDIRTGRRAPYGTVRVTPPNNHSCSAEVRAVHIALLAAFDGREATLWRVACGSLICLFRLAIARFRFIASFPVQGRPPNQVVHRNNVRVSSARKFKTPTDNP